MSQEAFLRNSDFIREILSSTGTDAARFPVSIAYPLVRYSVGEWIKTGAVMSSLYFSRVPAAPEAEEPLIEPLSEERDDEAVTPVIEQDMKHLPGIEFVDDEGEVIAPAGDEDEDEDLDQEEEDLDSEITDVEPLSAAVEIDAPVWEPVTHAIDEYFAYLNRLVLFSPEIHKDTWQEFLDEAEAIFSKATLTPIGLAQRFAAVSKLYRDVAKI